MLRVRIRHIAAIAILLCAAPGLAMADEHKPVDDLFDGNHLKLTKPGSELSYRFQRSVSHEKILGTPFSDDIKLDVLAVKEGDKRDFQFKVFSGERARDPFPDHDRSGNPLLLWYLDRSVNTYKGLAGGSLTYVKTRFMEALRAATAQPVKVEVGGKTIDAASVTLAPYAKDANAVRMMGYENSHFKLVYSDAVPGYFIELVSTFENTDKNAPRVEERVSFVGEGEKK